MSTTATAEAPATTDEATAEKPAKKVPQLGRRSALRKLFIAAGAGTVGAVGAGAIGSTSAGAATGNNAVLGTTNAAETPTLIKTSNLPSYGLGVIDSDKADNFTQAAFFAHASGPTGFYNGLEVSASGPTQGIFVHAEDGPGGEIRAKRLGLNVNAGAGTGLSASCGGGGTGATMYGSGGGRAAYMQADGPDAAQVSNNGTGRGIAIFSRSSQLRLDPSQAPTPAAAPQQSDVGEVRAASDGTLWFCVTAGNPGTWRKLSGPSTAGAMHVLPAPARVYDSRPFTRPNVGTKSPFVPDQIRTFDLKVNDSGVPAGATAALVNVLLVNAFNGSGNVTVWAAGVPKPAGNSMVWGGSAGRFSTTTLTALDANAQCQIATSAKTDLVLDVVAYYL